MNKAVHVLILLLLGAAAAQLAHVPAEGESAAPDAATAGSKQRILATGMPPAPEAASAVMAPLGVAAPLPPRFTESSRQAVRIIHVVPTATPCGLEPRS